MKIALLVLLAVLFLPHTGLCAAQNGDEANAAKRLGKIRIVFGGQTVVVCLFDTPASRDFMTMLPLQVEFTDFAGTEKIAYLPRRLNTSGMSGTAVTAGDFTYYKPWGNLAVFYKGFGGDGQLAVLGRIESGKDALGGMSGTVRARIEMAE